MILKDQHFTNPGKKVEFSCQGFLRILVMRSLNKYKIDHLTCETLILSRLGYRVENVFLGIHFFNLSAQLQIKKRYCFTVIKSKNCTS